MSSSSAYKCLKRTKTVPDSTCKHWKYRVKMKPPWQRPTGQFRAASRTSINIIICFGLVVLLGPPINCDTSSKAASVRATRHLMKSEPADPSPQSTATRRTTQSNPTLGGHENGFDATDDLDQELSQSSRSSDQISQLVASRGGGARFALDRVEDLIVIASSWQSEVYLPCKIIDLDEDQTVSWIRKRDSLVLTVDKLRLIDDTRFQLAQASNDWTLVLSQPNDNDAGFYECQVSSMEPKLSQLVELRLVEAKSAISNFSSLFVRPNERINVTCTIEAPQKTDFVYWYKNKQTILFDSLKSRPSTRLERISLSSTLIGTVGSSSTPDNNKSQLISSNEATNRHRLTATNTYTTTNNRAKSLARQQQQQHQDMSSIKASKPFQLFRSSSSLIINETQLNDTANYTCLKLQIIDDNMKSALRSHIIRKRQRLKQEIEQDAIEKRLRKEKELKRIQDAMTLDQIKEQLSVLEKRLETLKNEKHDLFVQLKQVLKVGNTKTKQECPDEKVQNKSDVAISNDIPNASKKLANPVANDQHNNTGTTEQSLHPKPLTSNTFNYMTNDSRPLGDHQLAPPTQTRIPTIPVAFNQRPASLQYRGNRLPYAPIQFKQPSNSQHRPQELSNFSKQSQYNRSHNQLGPIQTNFRSPLAGPLPDFLPPGPYDPSIHRRLPYPDLGLPPNLLLTSDSAISLATRLQNESTLGPSLGVKRSSSVANLSPSGQLDDRSRKKPNSFALFPANNSSYNTNHNLTHDFPANLTFPIGAINQKDRFSTASPTIKPVPINFSPPSRNRLPQPLVNNFDYLSSRNEILLPNFNQLYSTGLSHLPSSATDLSSPLLPAQVLYPGSEQIPMHHQLTRQINGGFNSQLAAQQQQQEHASRYYISNPPLVVDYRRKPHSKSSFHPKI